MELQEREVNLIERTFVVMGVLCAIVFSLLCLAVLLWPNLAAAKDALSKSGDAAAKDKAVGHKYVGAATCGMCHKSDAVGNQLKVWQESKHAKAFATLGTKEAKEIAEKAGVKGDPQKAPQCVKCHVTAFGVDPAMLGEKFKMEDGVQCEACHGAGGDYKAIKIMKDKKAAIDNGLVIPDEKTCRGCHNEEAPTFKGFDFKERWKKIDHKRPEKKETPAK